MWRRLKPQLVYARSQKGQGNGGYGKFFDAKYVNNYRPLLASIIKNSSFITHILLNH
jgi:hypothetical protein